MKTIDIIRLAASSVAVIACFILRHLMKPKSEKGKKNLKTLTLLGMVVGAWYFVGSLLNFLSGKSGIALSIPEFEMFSPRVTVFGISVPKTTVVVYIMIGVITLLALAFRLFAVPRFSVDDPTGIQNAFEGALEWLEDFVHGTCGTKLGEGLTSYMLTVAVYMMGCALTELFGQRAPTSDLTTTFSLALCTFFLINFYGIKQKGVFGRIKFLASPSPIMFPMKVLSDCAVPVSLACRLFGNMLGGLIVMELLRASLGGYSAGVSSLLGIYFNLAHPLIQTYVFATLSLTFINEASEDAEE